MLGLAHVRFFNASLVELTQKASNRIPQQWRRLSPVIFVSGELDFLSLVSQAIFSSDQGDRSG